MTDFLNKHSRKRNMKKIKIKSYNNLYQTNTNYFHYIQKIKIKSNNKKNVITFPFHCFFTQIQISLSFSILCLYYKPQKYQRI